MPRQCPECDRVIYNRRLAACEFCGADIPEHLRLSPDEIASIDEWKKHVEDRSDRPSALDGIVWRDTDHDYDLD